MTDEDGLTEEMFEAIRQRLDHTPAVPFTVIEPGVARVQMGDLRRIVHDAFSLLAEVERLRAALARIIERYEQTQIHSHGDGALLPLDHWNLPRAMQQEARDALGLGALSAQEE